MTPLLPRPVRFTITFTLFLTLTSYVSAATVTVALQFDPPTNDINRLTIGIPGSFATDTSDVTGTINASIEIDELSGVISSMRFDGGSFSLSDFSINTGLFPIVGTGLTGGLGTSIDTVNAESFPGENHFAVMTAGSVFGLPASGLSLPGAQTGTIVADRIGATDSFLFRVELPIDGMIDEGVVQLTLDGTLAGQGIASVTAVPEPASVALLLGLGGAWSACQRRRVTKPSLA